MIKVPQSADDLQGHLEEQLQFLRSSAESYDNGFEGEAERIAVVLRLLLHDTSNSQSLLGQLGLKNQNFYDTAAKSEEFFSSGKRIGSFAGLVGVEAGDNGGYVPFFDESPPGFAEYVPFSDYWERVVFIDNSETPFTRKGIVLAVANQDGGAHIDPNLDETYHRLSRENSMGWETSENGSEPQSPGRPELSALRQIAHEVLRTLISDYPHQSMQTEKPLMSPGILIQKTSDKRKG